MLVEDICEHIGHLSFGNHLEELEMFEQMMAMELVGCYNIDIVGVR